ncbi:MAG TPA: redox-sensing transcriptional repressor Rex [Spirochaetota bacterium]|nr:redox-sensing transcriptional repressor Rex [Spirochaetota bacterium]HQJ69089.1 redox-sensing transcriptional repressor Rex [Spirochaetota bacterium]HRS75947.1 redox-sensing transcriptional repressor Rex [Spirochaetota bacterium]HRT75076.1 redox-sensing transcriptional repressor Rex [Spirochaetota bacterium]
MIITKKNKHNIPRPTLIRLCKIYALLDEMHEIGETSISSQDIGRRLNVGSHNIRKDMGFIDQSGISGTGYDIATIKDSIKETLGFGRIRKACVIGLGNLGSLLINNSMVPLPCFSIVAGFDSSINTLEIVKTAIPVYPTYEIPSVLKKDHIEVAIIAEKDLTMDSTIERLIDGGIKGIINFTPVLLNSRDTSIEVRNIDIFSEFRYMSALLAISGK